MDIARELAQFLADAGFGTLGDDIHVSQIPSDSDGVYVVLTGGTSDFYSAVQDAVIDVYVRNASGKNAVDQLNQIWRRLHRAYSISTSNAYIYSILALGNVETVDRDLEYSRLFKMTFNIKYRYDGMVS